MEAQTISKVYKSVKNSNDNVVINNKYNWEKRKRKRATLRFKIFCKYSIKDSLMMV